MGNNLKLYKSMGINYYLTTNNKEKIERVRKKEPFIAESRPPNFSDQLLPIMDENFKIQEELKDIHTFEQLYNYMLSFNKCPLKETAMNMVLGDGALDAKIMLIGEAPGADEDQQGKPFVGRSGKLLMKAFESVGLTREKNLFITNTVFWRPPGNRDPSKLEVEVCLPIIHKIVDIISPQMVILVGKVAANNILATVGEKSISSLLKKWTIFKTYYGKEVITRVIYHPAYLLRSPNQKKVLWADLLEIKNKITSLNYAE